MLELHRLYRDLRDQVIAPPTYSLFWLQTLSFALTEAFQLESFLFVLLDPFYQHLDALTLK